MSQGVVLLRSSDPEAQLQALRTTLSLSLGDRPADLLVAPSAAAALTPAIGSEAHQCLETLHRLPITLKVDHGDDAGDHAWIVERLAGAEFVQVF